MLLNVLTLYREVTHIRTAHFGSDALGRKIVYTWTSLGAIIELLRFSASWIPSHSMECNNLSFSTRKFRHWIWKFTNEYFLSTFITLNKSPCNHFDFPSYSSSSSSWKLTNFILQFYVRWFITFALVYLICSQ